MPITYIGKTTHFKGKTLFEILSNLKNFGVGRLVVRSAFQRYPEPTFYIIKRVEPQMDEENKFGRVWVEKCFRGKKFPGIREITTSYKPDFCLVSKEDEGYYLNYKLKEPKVERTLPREIPFPPLLREVLLQERKGQEDVMKNEPMLELHYRKYILVNYRAAEKGETPSESLRYPGLSPEFLKGIKVTNNI